MRRSYPFVHDQHAHLRTTVQAYAVLQCKLCRKDAHCVSCSPRGPYRPGDVARPGGRVVSGLSMRAAARPWALRGLAPGAGAAALASVAGLGAGKGSPRRAARAAARAAMASRVMLGPRRAWRAGALARGAAARAWDALGTGCAAVPGRSASAAPARGCGGAGCVGAGGVGTIRTGLTAAVPVTHAVSSAAVDPGAAGESALAAGDDASSRCAQMALASGTRAGAVCPAVHARGMPPS